MYRWTLLLTIFVAFSLEAATAPAFAQHHGPNTCISGYVWREAYAGDVVCVRPAVRSQTRDDNRKAASRRQPGGGAYGPNTCRQGYVWRGARQNDFVCVTPRTRDQAAADNRAAASRRVNRSTTSRPTAPAPRPQHPGTGADDPYGPTYDPGMGRGAACAMHFECPPRMELAVEGGQCVCEYIRP